MICRNHVDVSEGVRNCSRCGAAFCHDCLVDIAGAPFCATCKAEQLLDLRSGVATTLDLASIGRRFGATFIDGLITGIPAFILVIVWFAILRKTASGSFTALFWIPSVLAIVYQASMLQARGQTLGKMAMKVKVVRPDGADITRGQAWGREVSRAFLGFLYIVDYLPAFFTSDRRTLHDMLAGTRVVNWNT